VVARESSQRVAVLLDHDDRVALFRELHRQLGTYPAAAHDDDVHVVI